MGEPGEKVENWIDHYSYLVDNDLADFSKASSVTGNKFCFLKREVALLDLALQQYAMNKVISRTFDKGQPFIPISPPELVHSQFVAACGFNVRAKKKV